jgi:hypothetical protein
MKHELAKIKHKLSGFAIKFCDIILKKRIICDILEITGSCEIVEGYLRGSG